MTDTTQPEALRLANVCSNLTRYSMDAHLIAAELRRLHAENETLRMGYAAARLEIESLQRRVLDAAFEAVRKKLCALPRYSFVLDDDGLVRRVLDRSGNWIEFDEAHALFDPVSVDAARKQGASHD